MALYMVIESIRDGCLDAVYRRYHERGRMLPDALDYIDSWFAADGTRAFQLMRTAEPDLFDIWTARRADLVEFEIVAIGPKPGAA